MISRRQGLTLSLFLGCGGGEGPAPPGSDDWPPVTSTYEVSTGDWEVPAGTEKTVCYFDRLSTEEGGLSVVRYAAHMEAHSHHFNMAYLPDSGGFDLPDGLGECEYREYIPVYLTGSQWPDFESTLPEGKALWIPDGAVVILEAHFVNTTDEVVTARVDVQMDTVARDAVEDFVGVYFNQMRSIEVPPESTETLRARCPAEEETNVWFLTSHMHHFGDLFTIGVYEEGSDAVDVVYESTDYAHPEVLDLRDAPIVIEAGQGFEWSCRYTNPNPEPLVGGDSALENEMCIMAAFYWPDQGSFQYCYAPPEP